MNIDDCWAKSRSSNGTIVPDPDKFPDGMRAVSDKLHTMGLKFGATLRIPHIAIHALNFTVSVLALLKKIENAYGHWATSMRSLQVERSVR